MEEIQVGDVGTALQATFVDVAIAADGTVTETPIDLSAASSLEIWLGRPSEDGDPTLLQRTASLSGDGTDGVVVYVTVAGDIDVPGSWQIQGYVVVGSSVIHSRVEKFKVKANIAGAA